MSGGTYFGKNSEFCEAIFDYRVSVHYGLGSPEYRKNLTKVRKQNPMCDIIASELLYDIMCLVHSMDYLKACDISEDMYDGDLAYFKRKWFKGGIPADIAKEVIDGETERVREELTKMLAFGER